MKKKLISDGKNVAYPTALTLYNVLYADDIITNRRNIEIKIYAINVTVNIDQINAIKKS